MSAKNIRRIVASPLLLIVSCICIVVGFSLFLFFVLYPPCISQMKEHIWLLVAIGILTVVFPIIGLVHVGVRRFFTVIQMDEEGISRSLFGRFCKLSMKWNEIYEISYFESGMAFLIFSQTKSIQGLSYWKICNIKNLIQIQLTQKNYDFIKQYIQQPIKGLTDAKLAQLKIKK